jgi:hypothetical protein
VEDEEAFAPVASKRGGLFTWTRITIAALTLAAVVVLFYKGWIAFPDGGKYPRFDHDHDDLMIADAPNAGRTLTVVFVGNSLTFANDLPAMLVDIASSDPAAPVRLEVKGETKAGASLDEMLNQTGALAWIKAHHVDDVVLQEHSHWFVARDGYDASSDGYDEGLRAAEAWSAALKPTGATPVVFEVWADADGGDAYTDKDYATYGQTSEREAANALQSTQTLASRIGTSAVLVGQAFETARETPGVPDVWGPDRHHPSAAGTYLAALVFYRYLTGRTGAETTYRPLGLSAEDAAKLQRIAATT